MSASDAGRDDQIGRLIALAGRRPAPDPARMARARAAARAEWTRTVRARGRRRWFTRAAGALVAAAAIALVWLWVRGPAPERFEIATIYVLAGVVRIADPGTPDDGRPAAEGSRILARDRVEVGERGRAALALRSGASVRLNAGTSVVFASADRIVLQRGTVYVDSDGTRGEGTVIVETPFGRVTHVGTQFEVRLRLDSMDLRVREGEVILRGADTQITARAGEGLRLSRNAPPEKRTIATSGPDWDWVAGVARPFTLEGATVADFLEWAARELGWRWEYQDAATQRVAEHTILHGSVDGLTPAEALDAVLPSANLTFTRTDNRLIVRSLAR